MRELPAHVAGRETGLDGAQADQAAYRKLVPAGIPMTIDLPV
jgi:hypothetical protein